ncbi:RHS repeat-associated core domain-containing protein [Luteibacter sp. PPL201]|uniref:RHS repeat-associated core domain-containing protein n=1 Tax=Luteibacter sahnii TaxID=3021977 RepID=A0ABT6BAK7_9GAMM
MIRGSDENPKLVERKGISIGDLDYRPYGEQTLGLSSPGFGYSGHVNDPDTGLVYMQARYFDPTIGRFYGVDPKAPDPGKLENFNRYAYARSNPVRYVDLDGKQSWCTPGNCGADSYLKASNDIAYFRENFDVVAEVKGAGGPGLELNYNLSQGRVELNFLPVAQGAELSV